jgi:hypothetical protein
MFLSARIKPTSLARLHSQGADFGLALNDRFSRYSSMASVSQVAVQQE